MSADGRTTRRVRLDPATVKYVADIARLGLFGSDSSDVMRWLIMEGVRKAVADGLIAVRRK